MLLLLLTPLVLCAQEEDETMQVRGVVKFLNDAGEQVEGPEVLWYGVKDKKVAREAYNKLQRAKLIDNEAEREVAMEEIRKEYTIDSRAKKGQFKKNALPSMAIIFVDQENGEVLMVDIEKGKTQYKDLVMKLKQTKTIIATGEAMEVAINVASTDDADDGNERFGIKIKLPPGTARTDSRMIIQTYAVDCQTEDTLGYLASLVFEGDMYHQMQEKRMAYNYDKNDKLAKFYRRNAVLKEDKYFVLDTVLIWPKPAGMKDRSFRGPFTYVFEDFHHPYYRTDMDGSCLKRRPFKMLDFTAALHDIELTQEFYEQAEANFQKKNTKINLRFEVGTSKMIEDSLNYVERNKFVREISSYGNSLVELTIVGGASPDGSMKHNEELARQRANVARGMLGRIAITPRVTTQVYTWTDVANTLREQGKELQAEKVEEIVQAGGDDMAQYQKIKQLNFYDFDIVPVLNGQRAMVCKYMYQNNRPMEPEECVQAFRLYRKAYWDGDKHFSNGDFYNLYDMLEDSLEIDTLTTIAYREITSVPEYEKEVPISPYICNLMAIQQMKRGTPNVEILKPFIDYKRRGKIGGGYGINVDQYVAGRGKIKFNRQEIVANQAACYYMEQKVDTALFLIEWLKECKIENEGIEQLENLINLKKLHFKGRRTPKEEADYKRAKNAVLAMSNDNKAILYTEIEDWGQRDQAMQYVDQMDDGNPRKWYLKGMLAALKLEKEKTEDPLVVASDDDEEAEDDGQFYKWSEDKMADYQWSEDPKKVAAYEEYMKELLEYRNSHNGEDPPSAPAAAEKSANAPAAVDVNKFQGIPQYIGYFQHAFDLDPTKKYFRYYGNESNVSEDLRKKYPYKFKKRPLYRELFKVLKKRDDSMKSFSKQDESQGDAEEKAEKDEQPETATDTEKKEEKVS